MGSATSFSGKRLVFNQPRCGQKKASKSTSCPAVHNERSSSLPPAYPDLLIHVFPIGTVRIANEMGMQLDRDQ